MGSQIKGYSILGKIAKGGMGEVYKALHIGLQKEIILKKLSPKAPAAFYERFKREAVIMMDISHPNIVHMYDYFQDGGSSYIVMEYIDGYSLSELIRKYRKLPVYLAAYIALEIASGLKYAHSKEVIHRDIKPGNVLLSVSGEVKLTDFGIAFKNENRQNDGMTKQGTILGTPAYMSPEQIRFSKNVDGRSDLYSLGILFYEMLGGKRPYSNDFHVENIRRINKGKCPNLKRTNRNIPFQIIKMIKKLMHPNKERRYQTAEQFITEITKFIEFKFKDFHRIREDLAKIINEEDTIVQFRPDGSGVTNGLEMRLKDLEYPSIFMVLDSGIKIALILVFLWLSFLVVKNISPEILVLCIGRDRYAVVDITVEKEAQSSLMPQEFGGVYFSLISSDSKIKYHTRFKKVDPKKKKRGLIIRAGKYTVLTKYCDSVQTKDFFVRPSRMVRRNSLNIKIREPSSEKVNVYLHVTEEDTQKTLFSYLIYYRETGSAKWFRYQEETKIMNGKKYDFLVSLPGYHSSFVEGIEISKWSKNWTLSFSLAKKKAELLLDIPPVDLKLKINQKEYWYSNDHFSETESLFLYRNGKEKKISMNDGVYHLVFSNEKRNLRIEKEIKMVSPNPLKLSFVTDNEGDIFVVSKR